MSYAGARFTSTLLTAVVGAVVGIGAFTFAAPTERWVAFGGGCVAIVVIGLAFLMPRRGVVQRVLDLPAVLIGVWLLVCSRAVESGGAGATPHATKWLNVAGGAALCGIGVVGLLLHEAGLQHDLRRLAKETWMVRAVRTRDDDSSTDPVTTVDCS
jgi:hypothetical protein